MAICPVANSIGCNKCGMVNFCFLKRVLGNYGEEQPGQKSEDDSMDGEGRVVSGTTTEVKTTEHESKSPN